MTHTKTNVKNVESTWYDIQMGEENQEKWKQCNDEIKIVRLLSIEIAVFQVNILCFVTHNLHANVCMKMKTIFLCHLSTPFWCQVLASLHSTSFQSRKKSEPQHSQHSTMQMHFRILMTSCAKWLHCRYFQLDFHHYFFSWKCSQVPKVISIMATKTCSSLQKFQGRCCKTTN